MSLLNSIHRPSDIRSLSLLQLKDLAQEIRSEIIATVTQNGGHMASNLGVVELTLALHYVFNASEDSFLWDVSHQCYTHKLLTGRNGALFRTLRKTGGISGFSSPQESPYDAFSAGHAGTAVSAALGMAVARDRLGKENHVIAVVGDGSLTCGITMEALNHVAAHTKRFIIVLNDNEWAIARNVGALARCLNELITHPAYNRWHKKLQTFLESQRWGQWLLRLGSKAKSEAKELLVPASLFEKYGIRYVGPIQGHDIEQLIHYLTFSKAADSPILLHVHTIKGKGNEAACANPEKFHGLNPCPVDLKEPENSPAPSYQEIFGQTITKLASEDSRIIGITAAMPSGTGLHHLAQALPDQFFDVGIAEEHAVIFAAGLAAKGLRPICAIYSTFLQRSFDAILHDVCLQNLPVLFCLDRAGITPNDGPTHHGLFDIAYLRCIPNAVLMQPKDEDELVDMLHTGVRHQGPIFIRYPRGAAMGVTLKEQAKCVPLGRAECLREGNAISIWALGPLVYEALDIARQLEKEQGLSVEVVNARFAKPIDREALLQTARRVKLLVTWEDHVISGGFGSAILEELQAAHLPLAVERVGWPDTFIPHATCVNDLRGAYQLDCKSVTERILRRYRHLNFD